MKIYIGGDHAGFAIKQKVIPWLEKQGHTVKDFGPFEYRKSDDYPDYVIPLAKAVSQDKRSRGIIIAGSGQGEVIATNRVRGVRTALYYGCPSPNKILTLSRAHNNSNILCMGAFFMNESQVKNAITVWLKAPFSNAVRHKRRLAKIAKFEKSRG